MLSFLVILQQPVADLASPVTFHDHQTLPEETGRIRPLVRQLDVPPGPGSESTSPAKKVEETKKTQELYSKKILSCNLHDKIL